MKGKGPEMSPVLRIHLELSQYPVLARKIRERMRQELFNRGIITPEKLDAEVKEKAILSQKREGLTDPYAIEPPEVWEERVRLVRDHLTDFYFAYNLPHSLFEGIVREVIAEQAPIQEVVLSIQYARYVKVIDVPAVTGGRYLEVIMDGAKGEAVGYLKK